MGGKETPLAERIYDAADDPAALDGVVRSLQSCFQAHLGLMFTFGGPAPALWSLHGAEARVFASYAARYHRLDPFSDALAATGGSAPAPGSPARLSSRRRRHGARR